jgi:hypothetical protein
LLLSGNAKQQMEKNSGDRLLYTYLCASPPPPMGFDEVSGEVMNEWMAAAFMMKVMVVLTANHWNLLSIVTTRCIKPLHFWEEQVGQKFF